MKDEADSPTLQIVPLASSRVLFPGLALRMPLREDHRRLQKNDKVVCVPLHPTNPRRTQHAKQQHQAPYPPEIQPPAGDSQAKQWKPHELGLFDYGCVARVTKVVRGRLGTVKTALIELEGLVRARINQVQVNDSIAFAEVTELQDEDFPGVGDGKVLADALRMWGQKLTAYLTKGGTLSSMVSSELQLHISRTPIAPLTYILIGMTEHLSFEERIAMLQMDVRQRTEMLNGYLKRQCDIYLFQNIGATQKESDDKDDGGDDDVKEFERKLAAGSYPDEVAKVANREIKRLKSMQPAMAEYHVLLNYLDWLLSLPWGKQTTDNLSIPRAREQLDRDHHGLEKVKKRILEYLAVTKMTKGLKGPILCFHGPPGVGKTSLGKSIAEAMGRKFGRVALGGVRDEAEIRGHRRTYVGALPGTFVQALRKAGSSNPVLLLDEIDKLGKDARGDPASALLEVLDPEQNHTFHDHYLNTPLDLSQVLFIATANDLDTIPKPLLDRMEVITLSGYTPQEKCRIAHGMLIPKQLKLHGFAADREGDEQGAVVGATVEFAETAVQRIVSQYTRESGVRNLEREIAAVCRYAAMQYSDWLDAGRSTTEPEATHVVAPQFRLVVDADGLEPILGPSKYDDELAIQVMVPGLAVGLAWTAMGIGSVLFIESSCHPGTGKLQLTGKLGSTLQESAHIALSWLRTNAYGMGLVAQPSTLLWKDKDVHVHLPAGAVPKDGPSAGVTLVASLVSLALNQSMKKGVAMTGEITLRGDVLPVGGIKEKALAAHQLGMRTLIMPARNRKDLDDIPQNVRQDVTFVWVDNISEMLDAAFEPGYNKQRADPGATPATTTTAGVYVGNEGIARWGAKL
ncbi:hypothetical protein RI367_001809 [Sorochytrium milnesiophthora]